MRIRLIKTGGKLRLALGVEFWIYRLYTAALVSLLFVPSVTFAQAWQLDPSVSVEGSYSDNFRLTTENPARVFSTKLEGVLGLSRITDTTSIDGVIGLDFIKYFGDTERLDDKDNQLVGLAAVRKWERLNTKLDFSFRRDTLLRSVRTFRAPDDIAVDPDPSVDDNLVIENVRRNRFVVRPSVGYALTEVTDLRLDYGYLNVLFTEEGRANLNDYFTHTLRGRVSTRLTEQSRLIGLLLASRYESEAERVFDTYEAQAGVSHDFDETTNLTFTLGGRRTDLESPKEDLQDNGFVFKLSGRKLTGRTRFSGILQRNVTPSATGNLVQTDSLTFAMTHELSPLLLFTLRTRLFENESLRADRAGTNRRSLRIEPFLTWTLAESWDLVTAYRYRREKRFDQPKSADSNTVFITLTYRPQREVRKP